MDEAYKKFFFERHESPVDGFVHSSDKSQFTYLFGGPDKKRLEDFVLRRTTYHFLLLSFLSY